MDIYIAKAHVTIIVYIRFVISIFSESFKRPCISSDISQRLEELGYKSTFCSIW